MFGPRTYAWIPGKQGSHTVHDGEATARMMLTLIRARAQAQLEKAQAILDATEDEVEVVVIKWTPSGQIMGTTIAHRETLS